MSPHNPRNTHRPVQRPIFILDTCILYEMLKVKTEGFDNKNQKNATNHVRHIENLFKTQTIYIPMATMIEIMSLYFHTTVDTYTYNKWYRDRIRVFNQQVLRKVYDENYDVTVPESMITDSNKILNRLWQEIPVNVVQAMQRKFENKRENYPREPKLFDGNDAVILEEAISIAEKHSKDICYLLTKDTWLTLGIKELKKYPHNSQYMSIPDNLIPKSIWDYVNSQKKYGNRKKY
ncbi:PIN domain-containing protein [Desulfobacter latus]|uniref:PIN domain-containing protein n=1 Tax=Desulfobacter latus TaxID=2292 RepID=A0A850T6B2_9BACT|nr:PIN domain-containing protein [Desulfobacter latus]NWH03878.1 hypothetical protein [Desulfobacter latus]